MRSLPVRLLASFVPYLILIVMLLAQTITHLAWLPISVNNGQMTVPYLLNHGGVLYDTVIEHRAPGLMTFLALVYRVFPESPVLTLRALNLLLILTVTVMVYFMSTRLARRNPLAGVVAAFTWFWLEPVYGNVLLYFDTVLGLIYLVTVALWQRYSERSLLFPIIGGLLLGGATLVKQQAWASVVIVGLWFIFFSGYSWRSIATYIVAALVLPTIGTAIFAMQGLLAPYFFWNWTMNFAPLRPPITFDGDFLRKWLLSVVAVPAFALLGAVGETRRTTFLIVGLWMASCASLLSSSGELHIMAQLPLAALMTGVVTVQILSVATGHIANRALAGFALIAGVTWLWMGVVAYVPITLGRAAIPAYDEFEPVAAYLRERSTTGETLDILPELDGSSQLHLLTDRLPAGLWTGHHPWFLASPGVVERLLSDWNAEPPDWFVLFPDMLAPSQPYIQPLVSFVHSQYIEVETFPDIPFNGDAVIYRLNP